ncbi:fimbria/pilus outer membrane usher protein [Burkholderia ubonensis]|uniref:fimbria/pilus outer membrane usher protein n=1 Tax=Burkholderia ubonensis TaxID=101571 RepID=UPI0009B3AB7D|nr:fimbria/pilus outer membrane usher protein [Burkholderia ubonensis]
MDRVHRSTRRCESRRMPVLRRHYALVLLAFSAIPPSAKASSHTQPGMPNQERRPEPGRAQPPGSLQFNPDFILSPPESAIDLSRYEQANPVWPGTYRADVYLNDALLGRDDVTVREMRRGITQICLSRRLFDRVEVDSHRIPPERLAALDDPNACETLDALLPGAATSFDAGMARLDVRVPQALLRRTARGYVDPSKWDSGITVGYLGYNANLYRNVAHGVGDTSGYVGLNAGFNVGGWYFRHDGSLNWRQRGGRHYGVANTYVQHDLTELKARVKVGDANTSGELFDTFAFRGVQIATDDRMWPDSQRGYAPVVRGIANSNARVTVRQSGVVIYDTTVPPGQFMIDDLYPTGYGGDLDVTVTESDGSTHAFKVPYASVAQALRPGQSRFSFVAGTVRNTNLSYAPRIIQATYMRGMSNLMTLYGGFIANERYQNVLAGGAFNTSAGAIALDVSGAFTSAIGRHMRGASLRVTYSKTISATNSNLSVAAYRFSSPGYLDLNNALVYIDNATRNGNGRATRSIWRARHRVSITASQQIGRRGGQLFVSGFTQDDWERPGTDTQFQIGYSNRYRQFDYSISANRARTIGGSSNTQYMLIVSLPLGSKAPSARMGASIAHDTLKGFTSTVTASALAGANNEGSYSISASRDAGPTYSGSASAQYRTRFAALQGAVGKGNGYGSGSIGVGGTFVAHPHGLTATPYTAETMAIVEAPAAGGAVVSGFGGIRLDPRGFAIVPYLNPYRTNQIDIDPRGLPADVELQTTSQQVAPRLGAVVMLRYPTVRGRAVLIRSALPDGTELPFGAPVFDSRGKNVGMVSQGGQIYARVTEPNENLTVKWGRSDARQCSIRVALPPLERAARLASIERFDAPCTPAMPPDLPAGASRRATPAV